MNLKIKNILFIEARYVGCQTSLYIADRWPNLNRFVFYIDIEISII